MKKIRKHRINRMIVWSVCIGAISGYAVLHPYAMVIYRVYENSEPGIQDLFRELLLSFRLQMLPMGIPFGIFGGVVGLFYGFWIVNKKKRIEGERMIETLQKHISRSER